MLRRRSNPTAAHHGPPRTGARTVRRLAVSALATGLAASMTLGLVVAPPVLAAPAAEYVVKDGDYLAGIARKLGTTLPDLLTANGLTVTSVVHPGDRLVVPANATNGGVAATPAPAATYTVKAGDSLFGISRKVGTTIADLLSANSLTMTSVLLPGAQLIVPANATNPGATKPAAATATPAATATSTYTVKAGDHLFGIARSYNIKLGTLLQLNKLTLDSAVHPGTTLLIPAGAVASTTASKPPSTNAGPAVAADAAVATKIAAVIAFAKAQLGKPYRFNAAGPEAFDCSGLTSAAYAQIGLWLPHQSAMQANRGVAVDWRTHDIQAGDLVFMFNKSNTNVISHVGLAINSWQWIQAPRSGDVVRLGVIPSDDVIQAVRRYVTD